MGVVFSFTGSLSLDHCHLDFWMSLKEAYTVYSIPVDYATLSVSQGNYDALLRWPLMARITFEILPQRTGIDAVKHVFRSDIASPSYSR
mgnify:CR=1 FL=1